jgi:hypothetical protein
MENITKDDIRRNIGKSANKLKNYLYVSSHKIFASIENVKPDQAYFYGDEIHEIFFDFKLSVEVDMGTLDGISEMITKVNDELNDYLSKVSISLHGELTRPQDGNCLYRGVFVNKINLVNEFILLDLSASFIS